MSLPSFSVQRPVLINLLVILVMLAGLASYCAMPRDQFPDVSIEAVSVNTVLRGAAPKEVEQLLTIPLEEQIAKVDDIDTLGSTSTEGLSSIFVEFQPGVDIFEKITEIQNQIERVERFPEEAENPTVFELKVSFDTVSVVILGNTPELELKRFADDFEQALKELPGVDDVRVAGLREREIWIEVDPYRMASFGLSLDAVARALSQRNLNLPGGKIELDRGEFTVRTEAEFRDLQDIENTILVESRARGFRSGLPGASASSGPGLAGSATPTDAQETSFVYLRDIAAVTDTFEEASSIARLDGERAVSVTVTKLESANAIEVVDDVKQLVDEWRGQLPAGSRFRIVGDTSIEIEERLSGLYANLGLGLLLVIASFTFFIGFRAALMVALGIPVAYLATFVLLSAIGESVNMLVLFGLILVLGLVVDDAIVVCENIYRHAENGVPLHQAAIRGAEEITWPVIATVATTVAAFLPLLLMEGVLGKFMGIIPVVVTLALIASLWECLAVLPVHVADWGGKGDHSAESRTSRRIVNWLVGHYRRLLERALRRRYAMVAGTLIVAVLSLNLAYSSMDFILFGGRDLEGFAVAVEAPPGASLQETDRILRELEQTTLSISEDGDLDSLRSEAGSVTRNRAARQVSTSVGELVFDLSPRAERSTSGEEIKERVRLALQDVTGVRRMGFEDTRDGPPVGKPIQVRIKGDSFDVLQDLTAQVKAFLAGVEGVKDIADNFPPGRDEVRPILDKERIASLGTDVRTIANEIRGAFDGIEATRVYDGKDEVEVRVRYAAPYRQSVSNLRDMQFATPAGMVPFSNIAEFQRAEGFSAISHHNQKRAISVTADVDPTVITSRAANLLLMEEFASVGRELPGYALDFGGEFEDTQESLASMVRAFALTIVLIYVILGGLFQSFIQPLIVMFSMPFAFIGVILGFFISNQPMGMFSTIGIIALCGIVVNDSLILIDFINRNRARGLGEVESILAAGSARLRPILLTSITTVAGLSPMVFGLFGVDEFLRPMAMAIAWGLFFATGLCLVVIPCVYRIFDDISRVLRGRGLALDRQERTRGDFGDREFDWA